jgi:hypothetical protein
MPDARYYARQAKVLLSISANSCDPKLAERLRRAAEDYLAKALKLKMDLGLRLTTKPEVCEVVPEP